ncbi:hypothetical protein TNCV_4502941 [Trichonephila clavipes]|nr:hypothetical protein TNCV_4502941 [Trichonephila clavipes]
MNLPKIRISLVLSDHKTIERSLRSQLRNRNENDRSLPTMLFSTHVQISFHNKSPRTLGLHATIRCGSNTTSEDLIPPEQVVPVFVSEGTPPWFCAGACL